MWLSNRNLLSQSYGGYKCEIHVLAGLIPAMNYEADSIPLLLTSGSLLATLLHCLASATSA